jgi:hypothetical protein
MQQAKEYTDGKLGTLDQLLSQPTPPREIIKSVLKLYKHWPDSHKILPYMLKWPQHLFPRQKGTSAREWKQ